jgi:predicted metal-dependent hydrolase
MVVKNHPVIVIVGNPDWKNAVQSVLSHDCTIIQYTNHIGYITRLADDHAALLLVDATDTDWRFWTTTPKTSPATRRIPIILIGDQPELREAGLIAGADLVISPQDLTTQLPQLVRDYARQLPAEQIDQLDCDCQAELPDLARQGIEKFNQRDFYAQHDLFEELWMATESPVRDLYRAVLQVGIAYYQILRGNPRGAKKMLLRSVQWLAILPDVCQGIDVAQLKKDANRVRAELERLDEDQISSFDQALFKPVQMVTSDKS